MRGTPGLSAERYRQHSLVEHRMHRNDPMKHQLPPARERSKSSRADSAVVVTAIGRNYLHVRALNDQAVRIGASHLVLDTHRTVYGKAGIDGVASNEVPGPHPGRSRSPDHAAVLKCAGSSQLPTRTGSLAVIGRESQQRYAPLIRGNHLLRQAGRGDGAAPFVSAHVVSSHLRGNHFGNSLEWRDIRDDALAILLTSALYRLTGSWKPRPASRP